MMTDTIKIRRRLSNEIDTWHGVKELAALLERMFGKRDVYSAQQLGKAIERLRNR